MASADRTQLSTTEPAGLEVVMSDAPQFVAPISEGAQAVHDPPHKYLHVSQSEPDEDPKYEIIETPWWRRKRVLATVAGLLVLAIIGGVVGGVVGSRHKGHTASSPEAPANATLSSISVTSFSSNQSTIMLLAYIDHDGDIRYSTRTESNTNDSSDWTAPQTLVINGKLSKDSGLATSTQVNAEGKIISSIFYVNESAYINSWSQMFESQSIDYKMDPLIPSYKGLGSTKLAAYGPWIAYQDGSGGTKLDRLPAAQNETAAEVFTENFGNTIPKGQALGSEIAIAPLGNNLSHEGNPLYWAAIYKTNDGSLSSRIFTEFDDETDGLPEEITKIWSEGFPHINSPEGAHYAVFATARGDKDTVTNVALLYQDEQRNIQQVSTDGQKWQQASPEALQNADNKTPIACLTTFSFTKESHADKSEETYPVHLSSDSDFQRCFFQRGGHIVEVGTSGSNWEEKGEIHDP